MYRTLLLLIACTMIASSHLTAEESIEGPACAIPLVNESGTCIGNCKDGVGTCINPQHAYEGSWKSSQANGPGILRKPGSSELIYRGEWKNGLRDGTGISFESGIPVYSGLWKDGKPEGISRPIRDGNYGISPGFLYLRAASKKAYVGDAYVDGFGTVIVSDRRSTVTRIFPSILGYKRCDTEWGCTDWCSSDKLIYGVMLGVGEGADNGGRGFAMTIGFAMGLQLGSGHFVLYYGKVWDPTVKILPGYISKFGNTYPSLSIQRDGSAEAFAANATLEVPLENVLGEYDGFGVGYTFEL